MYYLVNLLIRIERKHIKHYLLYELRKNVSNYLFYMLQSTSTPLVHFFGNFPLIRQCMQFV